MSRRDGAAGRLPGPLIAAVTALCVVVPCLLSAACDGGMARQRTSAARQRAAAARSVPRTTASAVPAPRAARSGPRQAAGIGLTLLTVAAAAGADMSYRGVEMISSWGVGGDTTTIADVWHRSGGRTLTQTAEAGASGAAQPYVSTDTDPQTPEGVLGVTKRLVALVGANYDVVYVGKGSAVGRPAQIVEARRADGGLAARFWLDSATKLPLRREVFDTKGRLVSEDVFVDLTVGSRAVAEAPTAVTPRAASDKPWRDLTAAQLAALRTSGWPVPGTRLGRLLRFDADEAVTKGDRVLDFAYSDGLFVVSVFLQRGDLPNRLAGWQKITLDGRHVFATQPDKRTLTWTSRGYVFTVLAEAPPATIDAVVDGLPRSSSPGLLTRLSRGLHRMMSWADPFR